MTTAQAVVHVTSMVAKPVTPASSCTTKSAPTVSPQSGAYTDFCIALAMNGHGDSELGNIPGLGDDAKEITISLPPGQIGSPRAATVCSPTRFRSTGGCANASQVGTVSAAVEGLLPLEESLLQGKVFNLSPAGTEAARLGVQIEVTLPGLPGVPAIKLESPIRLRMDDGGLDSVVEAPRDFFGIPIEMRRMSLRLWGSKSAHPSMNEGFTSNATDCSKPAVSRVKIVSYQGIATAGQDSYTPTDCSTLQYQQASLITTNGEADSPTPVTADIRVPAPKEPRVYAHVKEAELVLPPGFELSPAAAGGTPLEGCSDELFGRFDPGPAKCPEASKIGEVVFDSPLLLGGAISGPAYLGNPVPGKQLRFMATAALGPEVDAVRVKLEAVATVDPSTGQVTTRMSGLPPVPFTLFQFKFRGGPNAIVASPRACGTYTQSTTAIPYSGQPPTTTTSPIAVDKKCDDPARFAPELGASTSPSQAGADTSIITTMSRPDGHARLAGATVHLPPGLLGRLGAAAQCPLGAAATGDCPADTKVGNVVATAGPGPEPLKLGGEVYLTEGQGGDPAGLTITAVAKFGPIDLGKVVVPGRLRVRDTDQGLDLVVTDVPLRKEGISTAIRALEVRLDKPGFALNATNCDPKTITATLRSDMGTTADVSAPYQATGCENLPYSPKLSASLLGGAAEMAQNGHPGVSTTLAQGPGQANTRSAEIALPPGISIDVTRVNRACPVADFTAGACKPQSILGKASATTPLLNTPLAGNVVMVTVPGAPLPELRIQLNGLLPVTLAGKIQFGANNRLITVINPVPDVPLSKFDLSFNGGDDSVLQANRNLCAEASVPFDGTFGAQSGPTYKSKAEATIEGCGPTATLRVSSLKGGRPSVDLRAVSARTKMKSIQLVVPKGMEFQRAAVVRKRLRISAKGLKKGSKASITVSGTSIRVNVPKGQSATILRVRMSKGGLRVSTRLRKQGRPRLSFRVNATQLNGPNTRSTLRVRPGSGS
ncbi:MAG: hypothetical protein JHC95_07740 [Solirubrobacteraceae bacterium]|nr:hypothetical protein [Solirubrobacteraceae bacterium]